MRPGILWLLLCATGLRQLRNGMSGSVPVLFNMRMPPQCQSCVNHVRVPPKAQCCLSRISVHSSSLLAHTSTDTLCRCVCHGSAPFVGCGTRLSDAEMPDPGWGIGSPTAQRVHDRGGGRPRARDRLVFEGQAHGQRVFDCSLRFKDDV